MILLLSRLKKQLSFHKEKELEQFVYKTLTENRTYLQLYSQISLWKKHPEVDKTMKPVGSDL